MLNAMLSKRKSLWLRIPVLCLALGFMMQIGWIPYIEVSAADSVIFDLDISAYNAESEAANKGIVDSVTDTVNETITVTDAPILNTVAKRDTKYLAFTANGGCQYITIEDSDFSKLPSEQNMTIELWARNGETKGTGAEYLLLMRDTSNVNILELYTQNSNNSNYLRTDKSDASTAKKTYAHSTSGEWSHYALTRAYDSASSSYTWTLYINGEYKTAVAGSQTVAPGSVYVGGNSAYAAYGGDIGAFRIYNYALSQSAVSANYSAEVGDYIVQAVNLSSASPADNSDIIPEEGTITLKFDKDIDPDTIGGIKLQTEAGTDAENQSVDMSETSAKEVVVSYSNLSGGATYKLVIPNTLKSSAATGSIVYDGSELTYTTIDLLPVVEGDLLFEMDMSDYDAESEDSAKGITNAVSGNATEEIIVSGTPEQKTIEGADTVYLEFEEAGRGISVKDPVINRAEALSIEGWIRTRSGSAGDYMLVHSNADGSSKNIEIKNNGASSVCYVPNEGATAEEIEHGEQNKWAHYVFTRSFGDSGCDWSVYINGELKASGAVAGASMTDPVELTDYIMHIGGGSFESASAFVGDIAKLRIWRKALTVDEVVDAYDENSADFAPRTINYIGATPNGGTISTDAGSIKLAFDNFVDGDTLSAISFTKADGAAASGKVYISLAAERSKEVIISYGTLEPTTEYKVTVGAGLKSIYGVALTEAPAPITFTTSAAESHIFLDADFEGSDFVVGSQPPAMSNFTYHSSGTDDDRSNFEVRETTDGDKYIVFDVSVRDSLKSSQLIYNLPKTITTECVAFELGIKPMSTADSGSGTAKREFFRAYTSAGKYTYLGEMTSGTLAAGKNDVNQVSFGAETADDGFYHVKIVLEKGESGTYNFNLYPNYKTDPKSYVTLTFANVSFTDISKIMLAHVYPQKEEHYESSAVAISYIKGYYYNQPELLGTNAEEIDAAADEIILHFDRDLNEESLSGATFTLTEKESGVTSPLEFVRYDSTERGVVLKMPSYLTPGGEYSISAKDVMSADNIPVDEEGQVTFAAPTRAVSVQAVAFKDGDGEVVTSMSALTGKTTLSAALTLKNKEGATQNCILIAQVYDKNDRLIYVTSLPVSLTTLAPTETLTISYAQGFAEGDYVKIGAWNVTEDYPYSLMTKPSLLK